MAGGSLFVAMRFGDRQEVWETLENPTIDFLKAMATHFFGKKNWRFDAEEEGYRTHIDSSDQIEVAIRSGILKRPRMTVVAREELNPEWDDPRPWHLRGPFS